MHAVLAVYEPVLHPVRHLAACRHAISVPTAAPTTSPRRSATAAGRGGCSRCCWYSSWVSSSAGTAPRTHRPVRRPRRPAGGGGGGGGGGGSGGGDDPAGGAGANGTPSDGDVVALAQGGKLGRAGSEDDAMPDAPGVETLSAKDSTYDCTGCPATPTTSRESQARSATSRPRRRVPQWAAARASSPPAPLTAWSPDIGSPCRPGGTTKPSRSRPARPSGPAAHPRQPHEGAERRHQGPGAVHALPAQDVLRLSMFEPPDERQDRRGLKILQKGSQPIEILVSAHLAPDAGACAVARCIDRLCGENRLRGT